MKNEYELIYHVKHNDMLEVWVAVPKGYIVPITIKKEYDAAGKEFIYTCDRMYKFSKEPIEDPITDFIENTWGRL